MPKSNMLPLQCFLESLASFATQEHGGRVQQLDVDLNCDERSMLEKADLRTIHYATKKARADGIESYDPDLEKCWFASNIVKRARL